MIVQTLIRKINHGFYRNEFVCANRESLIKKSSGGVDQSNLRIVRPWPWEYSCWLAFDGLTEIIFHKNRRSTHRLQTVGLSQDDAIVASLGRHAEVVGLVTWDAGHLGGRGSTGGGGRHWGWGLDTAAHLRVDKAVLKE